MYNIYKHQENLQLQQAKKIHQENYAKWLEGHQQLKKKSKENMKSRLKKFMEQESESPTLIEDDHYRSWRYNKQFRDIQDANKFLGFKTFRHKPHYDIGKYFDERERKQIKELSQKKQHLIDNNRISKELRSRSLRSQGPLNPRHSFRIQRSQHQILQPRMRYTNVTDRQRFQETSSSFDDKFKKVYNTFRLTKSKLGRPMKSPFKNSQSGVRESGYSDSHYNNLQIQQIQSQQIQGNLSRETQDLRQSQSGKSDESKSKKLYFKSIKTLQMFGDKDARNLLLASQYDRKKDLTNLKHNRHNENFVKSPII